VTAGRPRARSVGRSIFMAILALLFYGTIAAAANYEHGLHAAVRAFGAQGFVSVLNTFAVTMVMERLILLPRRRWAAFALATGCAALWSIATTLIMHWAMQTPSYAATVLPPIVLGFGYCVLYSAGLARFVHEAEVR
jgi:fluoride ion exporter CrcB/FEX